MVDVGNCERKPEQRSQTGVFPGWRLEDLGFLWDEIVLSLKIETSIPMDQMCSLLFLGGTASPNGTFKSGESKR